MNEENVVDAELTRLREQNEMLLQRNERLTKRVLTKDQEFAKERNAWRREKARLQQALREKKARA